MCFSGTCEFEIGSGPKRGECGGGQCRCPIDYCVSCGDLTENNNSLCNYCEDAMNDFYVLLEDSND